MRGAGISAGGAADRILGAVPVFFSFSAFVLLAVALSSGMSANYLEDLRVISFDLSALGRDLIDITDPHEQTMVSTATVIGIRDYYSLHIGALCSGVYNRRLGEAGARPDIKECTQKFGHTDLFMKLDEDLGRGPFGFGLDDLGLLGDHGDGLRGTLELIPAVLPIMALFHLSAAPALAAGFVLSAISLALSGPETLQDVRRPALLGALLFTGFGWILSVVGSVSTTVVAETVKEAVNGGDGAALGLSAATGPALYGLLWASLGAATVAWAVLLVAWLRSRRPTAPAAAAASPPGYAEKDWAESPVDEHGFSQEKLEGSPRPNSYGMPRPNSYGSPRPNSYGMMLPVERGPGQGYYTEVGL